MAARDVRPPAVAGRFYPSDPDRLRHALAGCLEGVPREGIEACAAIVPHAALEYSGACAGQVFGRLAIPPTVLILAPNHSGRHSHPGGAGLYARGGLATPLGVVPVAGALSRRLEAASPLVGHDPAAHAREHAVEVELPFLQTLAPGVAVAAVTLAWDDWTRVEQLAAALAAVLATWSEPVLVLASTDLNHFESAEATERKDRLALEAIQRLDGEGLLAVCRRERISMCGRAAAAVALEAARRLGATSAEVVDHRHSGWVTGDETGVVGYAGVVIR